MPAYPPAADARLSLRDRLALQRTRLANERTLLAGGRTSPAMVGSAWP